MRGVSLNTPNAEQNKGEKEMTQSKTKKALLMSVLSMVLCVAMLVGMTFAWFTDTASTGVNKIQAGNLDVQLLMRNAEGTYDNIGDEEKAIFGSGSIAQNNNQQTLWEPGKTQVAYLAVRNAGNLALKYNIVLNIVDNGLAGALKYVIVPQETLTGETQNFNDTVDDWDTLKSKATPLPVGKVTAAENGCLDEIAYDKAKTNETEYFALVVHMDENAGNTYQGKDVSIDLAVVATQKNAESDSFGPDYDQNAQYPVGSADDFATAIKDAKDGDVITLTRTVGFSDKTVSLDKDITISGNDATVKDVYFTVADGKKVTFDGVNISDTTTIRAVDDATLSFSDCKFNITPKKLNNNGRAAAIIGNHQHSDVDLTLKGCTFNYQNSSDDLYNMAVFMWSNVKNVLIKDCEFNDYGFVAVKFLEMKAGANIVFEGNTFNMSKRTDANWYYNAGVQIHTVNQPTGECNVSFINNEFNGDYQTGAESEYKGYESSSAPIVAELLWNASETPLNNTVLTISGNTVNGAAVTEDNFVFIKGTDSSVK